MKKRIPFFLLIIVLSLAGCQFFEKSASETPEPGPVIRRIGDQFAPDPRDHVWEINARRTDDQWILTGATDLPDAKETLLKTLGDLQVEFIDSIRILPLSEWKNKTGVIRLSVANVRVSPSHRAELATQLLMGMPVELLEKRNGFFRIRTPAGYWLDDDAAEIMDTTAFRQWLEKPKVIVQVPYTSVRSSPDPGSPQIKDAVINDVMILERQGDYYHYVQLPGGQKGYIPADAVVSLDEWRFLNTKLFSIQDFITHLRLFYPGIPYLWGGTSIKGMDCSGFTKNVFHNFGYLLPRDASQQYLIGEEVMITDSLEHVKQGDLLFFGPDAAPGEPPKITHVAVYTGNGRIMHASGEIKEESLLPGDSLYNAARRKTLRGARRIFGYYEREIYPYYTPEALKIFQLQER